MWKQGSPLSHSRQVLERTFWKAEAHRRPEVREDGRGGHWDAAGRGMSLEGDTVGSSHSELREQGLSYRAGIGELSQRALQG